MLTAYLVFFTLIAFITWFDLIAEGNSSDAKDLSEAIIVCFSMLFIVVMLFLKLI